jgi:hypothetical protein
LKHQTKLFEEGNEKSLEKFLIESGLKPEEISKLKKEKNESVDEFYSFYTRTDKEIMKKIPVNRVIGIGTARGTTGISWFENLLNFRQHNFRAKTINDLSEKMHSSLSDFRNSFESGDYSGDNLRFVHFIEDDLYVNTSGGSHRTLFAKISGAEYIYAKVLEYKCDNYKRKNFELIKQKEEQLKNLVSEMNLGIISEENQQIISYKNTTILSFEEIDICDYSNDEAVRIVIDSLNKHIDYLEGIKKEYLKIVWFPSKIRKFVLNFKLNFSNDWSLRILKKLIDSGWYY